VKDKSYQEDKSLGGNDPTTHKQKANRQGEERKDESTAEMSDGQKTKFANKISQ
jgi:hypothetical protein